MGSEDLLYLVSDHERQDAIYGSRIHVDVCGPPIPGDIHPHKVTTFILTDLPPRVRNSFVLLRIHVVSNEIPALTSLLETLPL